MPLPAKSPSTTHSSDGNYRALTSQDQQKRWQERAKARYPSPKSIGTFNKNANQHWPQDDQDCSLSSLNESSVLPNKQADIYVHNHYVVGGERQGKQNMQFLVNNQSHHQVQKGQKNRDNDSINYHSFHSKGSLSRTNQLNKHQQPQQQYDSSQHKIFRLRRRCHTQQQLPEYSNHQHQQQQLAFTQPPHQQQRQSGTISMISPSKGTSPQGHQLQKNHIQRQSLQQVHDLRSDNYSSYRLNNHPMNQTHNTHINNNESCQSMLSVSMSASLQQAQSQVAFLKKKLIETHQKLLTQLEYSKDIDEQYHALKIRFDHIKAELQKKQKQKSYEKQKNEKQNHQLQQKQTITALRQRIEQLQNVEIGKQQELKDKQELCEVWRKKHEKSLEEFERLQQVYYKDQQRLSNLEQTHIDTQQQLKTQKDNNAQLLAEILSMQKETKTLQANLELSEESVKALESRVYELQSNSKSSQMKKEESDHQLEQLKTEYNNLSVLVKQKDKEIEQLRGSLMQLCVTQRKRKEDAIASAKTFVSKLQAQGSKERGSKGHRSAAEHRDSSKEIVKKFQQLTKGGQLNLEKAQNSNNLDANQPDQKASSANDTAQLKSYKEQKQQYMSLLTEVGDLQTQVYALNNEKNAILDELDSIEACKVKNNQLINRRRQLESMLLTNDRKLTEIKQELRQMKFL